MSDDVKRRRRYDSSRRQEQAKRSRRVMLETARRLFLERGFVGTTMPAIAAEAGVSVQTVYKAFANKAGLAKAVFDVAIAGDDAATPMLERAARAMIRDEPDIRTKLRLAGELWATEAPRHAPIQLLIRDAAASDPDAAQVWTDLQAERLKGMTLLARHLHEGSHLRSGVSPSAARDVLWAYNSADLYKLLVIERGWPPKRYGRWIADALVAALLPSAN